uniref:Putative ovule protein n=1 Tax=Solanum chacoense TaxID=4108 RepID=A0A0V0GYE4_SOLCH
MKSDDRRIEQSGPTVDSKWVCQSQWIGLLGLCQQAYQLKQSLYGSSELENELATTILHHKPSFTRFRRAPVDGEQKGRY